jgi:hypothetical protein
LKEDPHQKMGPDEAEYKEENFISSVCSHTILCQDAVS